jgi:hypothetical protein
MPTCPNQTPPVVRAGIYTRVSCHPECTALTASASLQRLCILRHP